MRLALDVELVIVISDIISGCICLNEDELKSNWITYLLQIVKSGRHFPRISSSCNVAGNDLKSVESQ